MSRKDTAVTMEEARRLAVERARRSYGTFIRVDNGEYDPDANVFKFPLLISRPQIIKDSHGESVIDIRFQSQITLGEIEIDGTSREIKAPHREKVLKKIRDRQDNIELAVRKALVSTSGTKFSHLPFLENQYSPLEDILSELILNRRVDHSKMFGADEERKSRYRTYLDGLVDIGLAESLDEGTIKAGNRLIGILQDRGEQYDMALNDAMGVYFENNIDEFEMINRTLGPYLIIAGRYYQRCLELNEMPTIHENELRDAIIAEYSGRRQAQKLLKFSQYLIQLQRVGVLQPTHDNGVRYWEGNEEIYQSIDTQAVHRQFEPIQELLPSYS